MELSHIQEFLEIAECGNFLESADNLEMSQSALPTQGTTAGMGIQKKLFCLRTKARR